MRIFTSRVQRPPHCVCSGTRHSCPQTPQVRATASPTHFCIQFRLGDCHAPDQGAQLSAPKMKKNVNRMEGKSDACRACVLENVFFLCGSMRVL